MRQRQQWYYTKGVFWVKLLLFFVKKLKEKEILHKKLKNLIFEKEQGSKQ